MFIVVTDNECDSSEVIFVSSKAKDYIFFLFSNSFNLILAPHNHANHFERVEENIVRQRMTLVNLTHFMCLSGGLVNLSSLDCCFVFSFDKNLSI